MKQLNKLFSRHRNAAITNLTNNTLIYTFAASFAGMAELVDALVSGISGAIRGGSSPLSGIFSSPSP